MKSPTQLTLRALTPALLCVAVAMPLRGERAQQGDAAEGEALFGTSCVACHSTGSDRLVGPGLAGVQDRRDREWLLRFITEPDVVIAGGDTIANRLLAEYFVPMPNLGTTRLQAEALLAYLASSAASPDEAGAAQPVVQAAPTEEQILLGQALFQGATRLTNGGPTCNSCHDVTHDAVIGGGILARELTTVFSRLGGAGVRAILGSPPFPVMQRAYLDRALTDDEVAGLVAFLQQADAEQALHQPRDYGIKLFGAGLLGSFFLLGLYSMAWSGRKRGSVHQSVFDRQTTTS